MRYKRELEDWEVSLGVKPSEEATPRKFSVSYLLALFNSNAQVRRLHLKTRASQKVSSAKLNIPPLYDPAITLSGVYPKEVESYIDIKPTQRCLQPFYS